MTSQLAAKALATKQVGNPLVVDVIVDAIVDVVADVVVAEVVDVVVAVVVDVKLCF